MKAFANLAKILALEQRKGYRNRAVIGGLERLAPAWQSEAQQEATDPAQLQLIDEIAAQLQNYTAADLPTRKAIIAQLLEKLGQSLDYARDKSTVPEGATVEAVPAIQPQPTVEEPAFRLDSPVAALTGVGPTQARRLHRLGVESIGDLLYLFPHRYDDFSHLKTINQLRPGEEITIIGTIWEVQNRQSSKGMTITTAIVADGTATLQAIWFNQPYLAERLKAGRPIVLSGRVDQRLGRLQLQSPEWEPLEKELIHTGRLVPVYPLTEGLSARWLRKLMKSTVDYWSKRVPDHLPTYLRERAGLLDLGRAIQQIHFPDSQELIERARHRLCFDEFLLIQLGVLRQRRRWQAEPGKPIQIDRARLDAFLAALPFALTYGQRRALDEIITDLQGNQPMSRLLQGDVGSGKTVVAAAAMLMTVTNDLQAVMMAPTEILAEQHYQTLTSLLAFTPPPSLSPAGGGGTGWEGIRVGLLIGSLSKREKDELHDQIAAGQIDIVVGTHALIQEGVAFKDLGLIIIDEQHRFGVTQRAALRQRGYNPHVLVMSATPIPRTLALTVYGDLDLSIIDELPPGRQQIKTRWLEPRERERAYAFLRKQSQQGRQAFIICPLIEESDKIEARAAVAEYRRLQEQVFPDLRLGLLHGRMAADEKDRVMAEFYHGNLDILVSTSVVEVGIDVPNATVMLVEGADRFGLAQLHQFRGRVGRGEHPSYCLLLADSPGEGGEQRLKVIEGTQDGFVLAEEDLKLRGPGEFFGTRQSGLPDLKVAKLSDVKILEQARAEAMEIFRRDPDLALPEHRALAEKIIEFWHGEGDLS